MRIEVAPPAARTGRVPEPAACWVIADHAAGNRRQALALAAALAPAFRTLWLEPRPPWSWLAPRCTLGGRLALPSGLRAEFAPPWPALAIGCGRSAALFTRMLRTLSAGRCYTVQILDPRVPPRHWDTVIAPRHDRLRGDNVLSPIGSLNPVDDVWLTAARETWPALDAFPRPRVGVLLGGPRHGVGMDARYAAALAHNLVARRQRDGGSLLVLASRRTPPWLAAAFHAVGTAQIPGFLWTSAADGPNPYAGVLAWADALVVTPDSVNMLSEACAVGCPVETFCTAPLPAKPARFHQALRDGGWLGATGSAATRHVAPLRETAAIAALVRARMAAASREPA